MKDNANKGILLPFLDRLADAVMIIDGQGTILYVNKAGAKLAGLASPDECIGLKLQEFTHPDFRAAVIKDLRPIKNREHKLLAEYRTYKIKTKPGAEKWVEGVGTGINFGDNAAAVVIFRDVTKRKLAEMALKKREEELIKKSRMLEEINTTLRVLLKRRKEDKRELEEKALANINELVIPYVEMLKKSHLDEKSRSHVTILAANLKNIVSPFSRKLSSKDLNLTPKEIWIASLIKVGKTTKEIAEILNITPASVDSHRHHIRNKCGLNNVKLNLQRYLSSFS